MKTLLALIQGKWTQAGMCLVACAFAVSGLSAQRPAARISTEISLNQISQIKGSHHPQAQQEFDAGRMDQNAKISGISIVFKRSAQQQADLEALIVAQQDPSSPSYHQWLTPETFAARFGMAQSDLDKVQTWLEQQGFSVDSVARSKNVIRFSGNVRRIEQAFATEMHQYNIRGERHFSPSQDLSVPSAIADVIESVRNLNDFRPHAMHSMRIIQPDFTSSQNGADYFAPGDIRMAYDVNPLLNSGFNGTGQSIVIAGQSAIVVSDIEKFQSASGLPVKDPTLVLVPGTGASTIYRGDESESDLDLEWSNAMAPNAKTYFVYTGSSSTSSVLDAIQFAVDEKIGNIISVSYGICEPLLGSYGIESALQQAAAQGQTVIAASGDDGSTGCYYNSGSSKSVLAVNYPASSAYVTGVGGTEISASNYCYRTSSTSSTCGSNASTYWQPKSSSDIGATINSPSVLRYIPEIAWNDSSTSANSTILSSSGGGVSTLYSKPVWQAGVAGIPSDGKRDVPDVAFYASPSNPGYLVCSSDSSIGITGSCSFGFRDASNSTLTVFGGTSVSAPVFAGMVAILNQAKGYTTGQGLINPTLYSKASNSTTYATAFHDVTSGNNNCAAGSTYCSNTTGYSAGVGYDQVTGLGSVDLYNLVSVWPTATAAPANSTITTVSLSNATPNLGSSVTVTVTVTTAAGSPVTSGNVTLSIDGGGTPYNSGGSTQTAALTANGTATFTVTFTTAGTHSLIATYAGNSTYALSSGSASATVAAAAGSFTVSAQNLTIAQGGSAGNTTITVTPANGYTGTVYLSLSTTSSSLTNICYGFTSTQTNGNGVITVSGTAAATTTLTLSAKASDCATSSARSGATAMHKIGVIGGTAKNNPSDSKTPLSLAFAGLLLAGALGRKSRRLRSFACVIALCSVGMAVTACGGGSSSSSGGSSSASNPPKGTYAITVTGQDSVTSSIQSSGTFTLTIN